MVKIAISLLTLVAACSADVTLYDEPSTTGQTYTLIEQMKGPELANSRIETCSYNNAYSGFACIEGTMTADCSTPGHGSRFSIRFANFGWIDPSEFTALTYYVRQKSVDAGRMNIHAATGMDSDIDLRLIGGAMVRVGYNKTTECYGLNSQNLTTYQLITVPISAFACPAGVVVNRFHWDMVPASAGWYIDRIVLVGSGRVHYPNPYPPSE